MNNIDKTDLYGLFILIEYLRIKNEYFKQKKRLSPIDRPSHLSQLQLIIYVFFI